MTILGLIIWLIIIGAVLYVVQTVLPIDARIKTLIMVLVIVVTCMWLLEAFGLIGPWHLNQSLPRTRY